jgi:uncharacterized protein
MARVYEFTLAGLDCKADGSGALYIAQDRALIVADLHLEKSSHFAARGQFLPPYESALTLAKLAQAIVEYDPRIVIALGDNFHDSAGHQRLSAENRTALAKMQAGRDWLWLAGNHDPELGEGVGGEYGMKYTIGAVVLRHIPGDGDQAEIAGHLHPVARVILRGQGIQRRCFIHDQRRLVMPAFGSFTGGLDIRALPFQRMFIHRSPSLYLTD